MKKDPETELFELKVNEFEKACKKVGWRHGFLDGILFSWIIYFLWLVIK